MKNTYNPIMRIDDISKYIMMKKEHEPLEQIDIRRGLLYHVIGWTVGTLQ